MAVSQSDGSIILTTKVDTSGLQKGLSQAEQFEKMSINRRRSLAQSLSMVYRQQGEIQSAAQKRAWRELRNGTVAVKDYQKALKEVEKTTKNFGTESQKSAKKANTAFTMVANTVQKLAVRLAGIYTVGKFFQFSNEASKAATQVETATQRLISIYGEASTVITNFVSNTARSLGMSESGAMSYAAVYGNLFSTWADQATNAQLTNQYLQMTAAIASQTGRTIEDVQERIRSGLLGNTEAIEDLGVFVNINTIEMTDAFKRLANGQSWAQLDFNIQQQIRALAILEQSTEKYGLQVLDTTALTRSSYQAAYEDMQATWGKFVNAVLMPVLEVLTDIMDKVTLTMELLGGFYDDQTITVESNTEDFSKPYAESEAYAAGLTDSLDEAVKKQNELTEAAEETAKEQENFLAGFDKITKIPSTQTTAAVAGAEAATAAGTTGQQTQMSISTAGTTAAGDDALKQSAKKAAQDLAELIEVISGALVAIGVVLLCLGQIGWGIGFIIAGASLYEVSKALSEEYDLTTGPQTLVDTILEIGSKICIVIGIIILVLKGPKTWAFGFLIAGASYYEVEAIESAGADASEEVQKLIADAMWATGTLLLAIGVFMLIAKIKTGLAFGFLVAGGELLYESFTEQWGWIKDTLQGEIGLIMGIGGALLVAIGIILIFALGKTHPKASAAGFGAIVAGVSMIVTAIAANWDAFKEFFSKYLTEIMTIVGGVLMALGVILIATAHYAIGIPLLIAGVAALVSPLAINWNQAKEKLSGTLGDIMLIIGGFLLAIGVILCCAGQFQIGIPLIIAGVASLVTPIVARWDDITKIVGKVLDKIKKLWDKLIEGIQWGIDKIQWIFEQLGEIVEGIFKGIANFFIKILNGLIGGINGVIGIINKIPGVDLPKIGEVPYLAEGAVIPPNREFLAVLGDQKSGTNIEAPLSTIKQALRETLNERGGVPTTGPGQPIVIYTMLDGKVVSKSVIKNINDTIRRTGVSPINV